MYATLQHIHQVILGALVLVAEITICYIENTRYSVGNTPMNEYHQITIYYIIATPVVTKGVQLFLQSSVIT